jgi:hypothetical protein
MRRSIGGASISKTWIVTGSIDGDPICIVRDAKKWEWILREVHLDSMPRIIGEINDTSTYVLSII